MMMTERVRDFLQKNNRIGIDRSAREVSTGYDGLEFHAFTEPVDDVWDDDEVWTSDDRIALADEMIARWTRYKERR